MARGSRAAALLLRQAGGLTTASAGGAGAATGALATAGRALAGRAGVFGEQQCWRASSGERAEGSDTGSDLPRLLVSS